MKGRIIAIQPTQGEYDEVTLQANGQVYTVHLFLDSKYKVDSVVNFTLGSKGSGGAYIDGIVALYNPKRKVS